MWQAEMVDRLKTAAPRARRGVIGEYAEMTGHSPAHLYSVAKQNGFDSGRKTRADAGECILTEAMVEFVAGLLRESRRENKGVIMPVERAMEIAQDNGIMPQGAVSVGRMQQILAERQLNKDSLDAATPHTDMRSLHPNHVHLVDASVCIQFYLKNGKTALIDERDFNPKKLLNLAKVKTRLTRYLLTDHFSGSFFVKYYLADGESQKLLYDFLISAWQRKTTTPHLNQPSPYPLPVKGEEKKGEGRGIEYEERYPFRGVPFLILWDAASAARARAMTHFIEGLGITTPKGRPYNPRRQGSVETTHNIVERWFESGLRFQPAFECEQLNAWARDWMIFHNATKNHTRHGMTRTASWMQIQQAQLRELPDLDVLQALFSYTAEENTRLVGGNYQISFALRSGEVRKYWLKHIPGILPTRTRVMVQINPFLWPKINVIYNKISYEVEPVEMLPAQLGSFRADAAIIGQEYKAQPETLTQQAGKRIENYAYGELPDGETRRRADAVPYAGITVMGNQAEKVGNLSFMPKRGVPVEVERGAMDATISFIEFLKRLTAVAGPISKQRNQELREQYGDGIDAKEADAVIAQMRSAECGVRNEGRETTAEAGEQEAM